ncbi:MAG: peroxiredoxin [Chlamydiia bacterium]|nr:peroxiredoxin [Chlamydiia bacterium]
MEIGQKLPEFSLQDAEKETVTRADVIGSPFILYFYPKDDTPGCTDEACQFRDVVDELDQLDFLVIGVSPDSPESHQKFIKKHELNFPLLCDPEFKLAQAMGVMKEGDKPSIQRSTFLFNDEGILMWKESPVKVKDHAQRVMDVITKED